MTSNNTIKTCLMLYPSLFKSKFSVLNHLFLVNGNGYEWDSGELVSTETNVPTIEEAIVRELNDPFQYETMKPFIGLYMDDLLYDCVNMESVENCINTATSEVVDVFKRHNKRKSDNILQIIKCDELLNSPLVFNEEEDLYPLSKYSAILNIPYNVTDDWMLCIKDFYTFMMNSREEKIKEYIEKYKTEFNQIDKIIQIWEKKN